MKQTGLCLIIGLLVMLLLHRKTGGGIPRFVRLHEDRRRRIKRDIEAEERLQ